MWVAPCCAETRSFCPFLVLTCAYSQRNNDNRMQFVTSNPPQHLQMNEDSEWLKDPWTPRLERAPKTIKTTALVCGAGFSGIQIGGQLKKAGVTDFKIMDRAGDFGGTWYW